MKVMKKKGKKAFIAVRAALREISFVNFLFLLIAGIINAFGVSLFLYPVKLYDSGISGLSMLLDQVTPPELTLSLFLIIFNIPIFLIGYKKAGSAIHHLFTVHNRCILVCFIPDHARSSDQCRFCFPSGRI